MSDWKALEALVVEDAVQALRGVLAAHPGERFYAAAFHGLYRERDGPVLLPSLAANSLAGLDGPPAGRFWDAAWNPPDWRWDLIEFESEALGTGAQAAVAAMQATRQAWLAGERDCIDMLVGAAAKIRQALGDAPQLAPDFVVFLHDEEGGPALVRRCIGDAAFARLFPEEMAEEAERRRVAALPAAGQVPYLIERLGRVDGAIGSEEAEQMLRAIGAPAVPALLARMGDGRARDGARHARLLGCLGVASPEVLALLQRQMAVARDEPARAWAARALAYLGQSGWLLEQFALAPSRLLVEGLCAPYSAFRDPTPLPLDYRPLETLLAGPADTAALARQILRPGSSWCTLRPGELDEALRGLASPHAFVRRHAASLLHDRGLGSEAGRRLLPALAERLGQDPDADVRWEALYSLAAWKHEARPWQAAIAQAAQHDADQRVREKAQAWLAEP